jgi:hypothetical protein
VRFGSADPPIRPTRTPQDPKKASSSSTLPDLHLVKRNAIVRHPLFLSEYLADGNMRPMETPLGTRRIWSLVAMDRIEIPSER